VLTHATGEVELEVPRDQNGTFEPVIAEAAATPADRGRRDRAVVVCPRADHRGDLRTLRADLRRLVSKETISRITDKVIEEMQARATRPLEQVYAAIFIAVIGAMVKVRDGQVANRPVYAAIGVTLGGEKDVLGLWADTGGEGRRGTRSRRPTLHAPRHLWRGLG